MVVYEVNLEFDVAIAAAYREWLEAHMREMLALPGFRSAQVHEVVDPLPTAGRLGLCVRYQVSDLAALETYQREHAPRLRADLDVLAQRVPPQERDALVRDLLSTSDVNRAAWLRARLEQ